MKRLLILIAVLTFGCSGMMSKLEHTESIPTYGTKSTGDSYTASEHNELYNALLAIYQINGIVECDGTDCAAYAGGGSVPDLTGTINADEIAVFSDADTLKALTGAEFQTAYSFADLTGTINADEITVFSDSNTLKALTEAEFKVAYNMEAGTDYLAPAGDGTGLQLAIADCTTGTCTADEMLDSVNISPTSGTWDLSALTLTFPSGGWFFTDEDSSPDMVGQLKYDNTMTGWDDGALPFYDDDEIKTVLLLDSSEVLSSEDDHKVFQYNWSSGAGYIDLEFKNKIKIDSKAVAYTIGTGDAEECYGGTIYVTSAATITACDNLANGMSFTVVTIGAIAVSLDVQSDDLMYLDGEALDDGDKATNTSTTGDTITCSYYNSTGWYCWSGSPDGDHWTDGGP